MKKIIWILVVIILIVGGAVAIFGYRTIFTPNVDLKEKDVAYLYIPSGSYYNDVLEILERNDWIVDMQTFEVVAKKKNYPSKVKAGRYLIENKMNNNEIVNLLRSGQQEPVKVTFNNIRLIEELAGKITKNIEADSAEFLNLLRDRTFTEQYGFTPVKIICMFLPDTYEMYWNTSAEKLIKYMARNYKEFWNEERKLKAKKNGFSQSEVSILASIVQAEQSRFNDEKPRIAGLYINRLRKNIPLQSDPTLVYALGDFSIKRVLNKDKEIESPFNTYKYAGLPPAPINLPAKSSIKAVLDYEKNNYIFMCAKDDFSGYHYFSKTIAQHNVYAICNQRLCTKIPKRIEQKENNEINQECRDAPCGASHLHLLDKQNACNNK